MDKRYIFLVVIFIMANTTVYTVYAYPKVDYDITNITSQATAYPQDNLEKFRVGPTVRIRPINDIISDSQDGLVELYMDNPSLNSEILNVDFRISIPSGVHVSGEGFGEAGAAGMVYGKFKVAPGSARTINIVIKTEKTGDFSAQFSGMYWPGDNKDAYQPISLTHPFKVIQTEEKFRVGPTVRIRPLNDVINKSVDGIVELYFDNPSLNDIPLTVDMRIAVPSGIHVYGEGFGQTDVAGMVYGIFSVPSGSVRTIYVNIKAEKTGDFYAQFNGMYYPGENKDAYQPISLTHPFKVVPTHTVSVITLPPIISTIDIPIQTIVNTVGAILVAAIVIYIFIYAYKDKDRTHKDTRYDIYGDSQRRKRICPECGCQDDKDAKFCSGCGLKFI